MNPRTRTWAADLMAAIGSAGAPCRRRLWEAGSIIGPVHADVAAAPQRAGRHACRCLGLARYRIGGRGDYGTGWHCVHQLWYVVSGRHRTHDPVPDPTCHAAEFFELRRPWRAPRDC